MSHLFKKSERGNCFKGMLIGIGLLVVLVAMVMLGVALYLQRHGEEFFANLMRPVAVRALDQSSLAESTKEGILRQLDRLDEKLKSGNLNYKEYRHFYDDFAEDDGVMFNLLFLDRVRNDWIPKLKLPEDEESNAIQVIQKTQRGIVEGLFDQDQWIFVQKALPTQVDASGIHQPLTGPTIDQISAVIGDLRIVVDEAKISEEEYKVDYVQYAKDLVDKILSEGSSTGKVSGVSSGIESSSDVIEFASPSLN